MLKKTSYFLGEWIEMSSIILSTHIDFIIFNNGERDMNRIFFVSIALGMIPAIYFYIKTLEAIVKQPQNFTKNIMR